MDMVGVKKIVGLTWFCTKALEMCNSAGKVDQNWVVKRIVKSSSL